MYILNFLEDYVMLMLYFVQGAKNLKGKTCEMSYIFFFC